MRGLSLQLPKIRISSGLLSQSAAHQPGCDVGERFQELVCWLVQQNDAVDHGQSDLYGCL